MHYKDLLSGLDFKQEDPIGISSQYDNEEYSIKWVDNVP